ncbi:TetR/AcrR family transcriptional regulator [Aquabacterium sp.]|jgi:AcrR family transcriptional regulator|uniref:TetR/AcrR family transcriptional regulator n=1 Tax=Aquabacterium TaxID=92793 RepID=UPI001D686D46|nr:TetR/AcrR family transcriptional regulator [Aquabacterium sp.]MBT9609927.1 TetR/AcrR family transcriptional regulator [Aquabacterium sp.]|tara:strand:- start:489 stop:1148 length:660 start_codon:yes stop_codon:yes gene_type:complete
MTRSSPDLGVGRTYAGESLSERTARRRQQFLDAGLEVFGTSGYRTATVRQLCRQAGLTDRYFYESFASTEDLLVAVYEREFDHLQHVVLAALMGEAAQQDPTAPIEVALNALFEMASEPRVARVCWLEVLGVSARVDGVYTRTIERFAALVVAFARQRFDAVDVDEAESRMLGIALIGAVSQPVTHWLLGGYREDRATMVAATSRVFRGVIDGLRQEAA